MKLSLGQWCLKVGRHCSSSFVFGFQQQQQEEEEERHTPKVTKGGVLIDAMGRLDGEVTQITTKREAKRRLGSL
jgi:hypothetical protein